MNDRDVENLLQRHRPADPPADLRARIVSAPIRAQRTWPWAAAAAALLAVSMSMTVASEIVRRRSAPPAPASTEPTPIPDPLGAPGFDHAIVQILALKEAIWQRDVGEPPATLPTGEAR